MSFLFLVSLCLVRYAFCTVEVSMENIINDAIPSELDLDAVEMTTYIPSIGSNVPVTIEAMTVGIAHGPFKLDVDGATFSIEFDQLVVTVNPYSEPTATVNVTVNGCAYELSGSMTFTNARIELPNSGPKCVYESTSFELESVKNNILMKAKDYCPRANSMIGIANHIPFWAAKPYVTKLAEQTILQSFNDLKIVIGDHYFKVCTDFGSNQLKFVLELETN